MSKIIESTDGNIYIVHDFEILDADDARTIKDQIEAELPLLEKVLGAQANPEAVAVPDVQADANPAVVDAGSPEQPVNLDVIPAPDVTVADPATPEAPAAPVAPVAPATDVVTPVVNDQGNFNPPTGVPITDPNTGQVIGYAPSIQ